MKDDLFSALVLCAVLASLSGCGETTDESEEEVDTAESALGVVGGSKPPMINGMCTTLEAVDYAADRCTLADVPDFVTYVQEAAFPASPALPDPDMVAVHEFLWGVLDGNAVVQCTKHAGIYCVDVVDRDPLGHAIAPGNAPGKNRNFFIAYADNGPGPLRSRWDHELSGHAAPDYTAPAVELSVVGSFDAAGGWRPAPMPETDHLRVMTFDPKDTDGLYQGYGSAYVNPLDVFLGWWPTLTYYRDSSCLLSTSRAGGITSALGPASLCSEEALYLSTGRR